MVENLKSLTNNHKLILAVVVVLVLIIALPTITSLTGQSILGFNQGSQGLGFQFQSVYFNNGWWSSTQHGNAPYGNTRPQSSISQQFGGTLNFQPDYSNTLPNVQGMPLLGGTFGAMEADVSNSSGKNTVYTWHVQNGTISQNGQTMNVVNQFQMERVQCTASFNVYLSGNGAEAGSPTIPIGGIGVIPNYSGTQVWIKITPQQFLYYQGNPTQFFIAPSLIQLTSNAVSGVQGVGGGLGSLSTSQANALANQQSTNPEAQGDTFYIYYNPTNTPSQGQINNIDSSVITMANGQNLDPSIFRDNYYICLNLNQFYAWNDYGFLGIQYHHWAFPSMNFKLTMYVWVIGEWTVYQAPGTTIVQLPHPVVSGSQDYFASIGNFLAGLLNPFGNMSWLVWALVLVAAVVILYYYLFKRKRNTEGAGKIKSATSLAKGSGLLGISFFDWGILGALLVIDVLDISIPGVDIATDVGTFGYFIYVWRKRNKS